MLFCAVMSAQVNLVPNPSFEDMISCPITISEMFKADHWHTFRNTPDYYHTCNNPINAVVGVPYNNLGFQYPHSGLAHAGIIAFDITGSPPAQREYLASDLNGGSLIIGEQYFLTFWVSWLGVPGFGLVVNKLGVSASTSNYSQIDPFPVTNNPLAYSDSFYTDSLGWSQVRLAFVADSSYQYIILGDFFDDLHTDTLHHGQFNSHCYYYIDDVCLSTDSAYCSTYRPISTDDTPNWRNKQIVENSFVDNNILNLQFASSEEKQIYIFSCLGQMIYRNNSSSKQLSIPLLENNSILFVTIYSRDIFQSIKIIHIKQ